MSERRITPAIEPVWTKDLVANLMGQMRAFERTDHVKAIRMDGPFTVVTPHGRASCADGWLAVDANGDPYPIRADVMDASYRPVAE